MPHRLAGDVEGMPEPTYTAVLFAAWAKVSLRGLSKKERRQRLDDMSELLAALDALNIAVKLRSSPRGRQTAQAVREARVWWNERRKMIEPA